MPLPLSADGDDGSVRVFVVTACDGDDARVVGDGVEGVGEEVDDGLVQAGRVGGERGGMNSGNSVMMATPASLAGGTDELDDLAEQGGQGDHLHLWLAVLGEGEHVHGELVDAVEVGVR